MKKENIMQQLTPARILLLILVGLLLAVISFPVKKDGSDSAAQENRLYPYRSQMEISLITFLSGMEGVGDTDVILYTKQESSRYFTDEKQEEEIIGVLISCEGGRSYEIQSKIIESVSALFGISSNKIKVLESVSEKE